MKDRSRTPEQALELLRRETRWHSGAVPGVLGGHAVGPGRWVFAEGRFLFRSPEGIGFHYAPGDGVTVDLPEGADPQDAGLWRNGSVYAAVACLNGLVPLHASAVAHGGRVHAFTGPSGAGKSTLIAGLGQQGLAMFCDDTLLLDLADPDRIMALPGHKRLKLTAQAIELTGATQEEPVGADTGKHYAAPPAGDVAEPLPLATLVFLEEGPAATWEPLRGAARFARLEDDHYTQELYHAARRPWRAELFAMRARIARQLAMARLVRQRSVEGFAASVALAAERIRSGPEAWT